MRILLVADPLIHVPPRLYGGIERIVDNLARHLQLRGHTVGLVAKSGSSCPVNAPFYWPDERIAGLGSTLRNAWSLRGAVTRFKPDLVHSFARLAYLCSLGTAALPKIMSYQRHTGGRGVRVAARLSGRHLRFTGCSEFICAQGRRAGGRWTTIPNFVDLQRFDFAPTVSAEAPLVFLSRLDDVKGPDTAIAIARAAGRRLILAGNVSAELRQQRFFKENLCPHFGRDGIEYIGDVDDDAKIRLLRAAAALVVPIRWQEPFGIVFVEALACGTPVISCPLGAVPEIIDAGKNGFLIAPDDVAAGVNAVRRLPQVDRRICRETVEAKFSVTKAVSAYEALYREMKGLR